MWRIAKVFFAATLFCLSGGLSSCDQNEIQQKYCAFQSIPIGQIRELASELGFEPPQAREQLLTFPIPKMQVLDTRICLVEILGRIPRTQLVFVRTADSWRLAMFDKQLVAGWKDLARALLRDSCLHKTDGAGCRDPQALADDLVRVFVDPTGQYGFVLDSRESIPATLDLSDRRRDLLRAERAEKEVRDILLSDAPDGIGPPVLLEEDDRVEIRFFSWNYFGGDVQEWRVTISSEVDIRRTFLVAHVGSFGYYY